MDRRAPAAFAASEGQSLFRAVGTRTLLAIIDLLLEGRPYEAPKDWGAFFLAFPSDTAWGVPGSGWHADAHYASPLWPAGGVKTLALFGDVEPRGGGTQILGGSHRLVHRWFQDNPPPPVHAAPTCAGCCGRILIFATCTRWAIRPSVLPASWVARRISTAFRSKL